MSLKNYMNESTQVDEQVVKYLALTELMEMDSSALNESTINETAENIVEGLNDKLNKLGLKIHKGSGILDYIKSFATGVGKVFLALIKGDTVKAKEILKTLKKEDVLDFIYKLDLGTLHLFTGPLHMIDAWTGWDLSANIKTHMAKAQSLAQVFKDAVIKLKDTIVNGFSGKQQKNLMKHAQALENGAGTAAV